MKTVVVPGLVGLVTAKAVFGLPKPGLPEPAVLLVKSIEAPVMAVKVSVAEATLLESNTEVAVTGTDTPGATTLDAFGGNVALTTTS